MIKVINFFSCCTKIMERPQRRLVTHSRSVHPLLETGETRSVHVQTSATDSTGFSYCSFNCPLASLQAYTQKSYFHTANPVSTQQTHT